MKDPLSRMNIYFNKQSDGSYPDYNLSADTLSQNFFLKVFTGLLSFTLGLFKFIIYFTC